MSSDDARKMGGHDISVRIHIDQKPYESPNPTTGECSIQLGDVPPGLIFTVRSRVIERTGIGTGLKPVHLKEDEHFHSGKPRELQSL